VCRRIDEISDCDRDVEKRKETIKGGGSHLFHQTINTFLAEIDFWLGDSGNLRLHRRLGWSLAAAFLCSKITGPRSMKVCLHNKATLPVVKCPTNQKLAFYKLKSKQ
jgi:hypothetical protein